MAEVWKDNVRVDKPHLSVVRDDEYWAVAINGKLSMKYCPYCLKRFEEEHHAQRVVDVLWPAER